METIILWLKKGFILYLWMNLITGLLVFLVIVKQVLRILQIIH